MKANLFLVAAPRSGSTQLAAWLNSHPEIELSSIKEPNYFSNDEFDEQYVRETHLNDIDPKKYVANKMTRELQFAVFRDVEQYDYLFSRMTAKWRLDASTSYLHNEGAPRKIHEYNHDSRIVILLREPVERALSHYRLALRTGRCTHSLRQELEAELNGDIPLSARFLLRPSMYEKAIKRYYDNFESSKILIIFFEQMIGDKVGTVSKICKFLNINDDSVDLEVDEKNSGDSPRYPRLNAWLQASGLKTWLRSIMPKSIKRRLKVIYFSAEQKIIDPSEIEFLRSHLKDSSDYYARLIGSRKK